MKVDRLENNCKELYNKDRLDSGLKINNGETFRAKVLFSGKSMLWLELEDGSRFRAVCSEMRGLRNGEFSDFILLEKNSIRMIVRPAHTDDASEGYLPGKGLRSEGNENTYTIHDTVRTPELVKQIPVIDAGTIQNGEIIIKENIIKEKKDHSNKDLNADPATLTVRFSLSAKYAGKVIVQANFDNSDFRNVKCSFALENPDHKKVFRKNVVNLFDALKLEGYNLTAADFHVVTENIENDAFLIFDHKDKQNGFDIVI